MSQAQEWDAKSRGHRMEAEKLAAENNYDDANIHLALSALAAIVAGVNRATDALENEPEVELEDLTW